MFFLILFILFLLILGLIFIETKIYMDLVIENSFNLLKVKVRLLGLSFIVKTIKFCVLREPDGDYSIYLLRKKTKKQLTSASRILKRTGKLKRFLLKTNPWEYTAIKDIRLRVDLGLGDAAVSAVMAGLLQSSVLTAFNFLQFKDKEDMHVEVYFAPIFEKIVFNAKLKCILGIKIAHIISTLTKKFIEKRRKNK